jgi:hypothetical protein
MTAFSPDASAALQRLGLTETQLRALEKGRVVAFMLSGVAEGTVCIARLPSRERLQLGIYTIRSVGSGLNDFITFELKARTAAKAVGAQELELMGIEITNDDLRAVLEQGGFSPTSLPVPEELGGGTFDALSRVESIP